MFSLEYIRAMQDEKTLQAKKLKLTPYIAKFNGDTGVRRCDFLGTYVPKGWEFVKTYFIDNSGFGSEGEGALTFRQLLGKVKAGRGYAIQQAGQFQVYINEYVKL